MKVIGTAGHIDHGKSTLVHRLTGIDPDRLSEEKQRGMTIDLGFAWLSLPSGRDVSLVDVPGHERFIKNMLAGAGGVDVALLVVAADEGVMPQTREHLDILDLLGVRHGVVALTKRDLVDEEWLELVTEDVTELLRGTALEGSAIVPVSAATGAGIPGLLVELDRAVAVSPDPPDRGVPYLPVDRVFTIAGFGTVVTGTLHDGRLRVGEEVEVVPGGRTVRIRGLQTHRRQVSEAEPGSRVAVNLAGIARDELTRGDVLARHGALHAVRRADAGLRVLPDAPIPLTHGLEVTVHVGSAERPATLLILEGDELLPGETGWVQLRFAESVATLRGQRFIVRLPAPLGTVAGGEIVDIAPRHRRSDRSALERLTDLGSDSLPQAVAAALAHGRPRSSAAIASRLGVAEAQVATALRTMEREGAVVNLGPAYLAEEAWSRLTVQAEEILGGYHSANPLRQGMPREELRSRLGWPQTLWPPTLRSLVAANRVREHGALVALPDHRGGTGGRRAEAARILAALRSDLYAPPSGTELVA
ncbi:MAG: selenocysteine-specific translation elongation factor, partial [Chloroflexi bacterium]|nr:selenocysteine-specific translation elongation factor [Chloroflexota bacterium]